MTKVLGIKAKHAVITPECLRNRGMIGAFNVAVARLRDEYLAIVKARYGEVGLNYHLVLTVEDTKRENRRMGQVAVRGAGEGDVARDNDD